MNEQVRRAELCAMTCYSGRDAFETPETMIRRAKAAGCSAIAITDYDTVRAFLGAACAGWDTGMKIIYGAQLTLINDGDDVHYEGNWYHVTVLARDEQGLSDLYRLISRMAERGAYGMFYVARSELAEHRAHLLIGSGGVGGEVYEALLAAKEEVCAKIARFYDYIEICPPCGMDDENGVSEVARMNRRVVELAKKAERPVAAVGYAEYAEKKDTATSEAVYYLHYRTQLPVGYDLHLRTTEEMLDTFSFLGEDTAYEVVVTNPQKIADKVEGKLVPLPLYCTAPYMEFADGTLESVARRAVRRLYGAFPPEWIAERLETELRLTGDTSFSATYLIWRHIADFCRKSGHPVADFHPSVGYRFLSYLLGIHRLNPLPPHYRCPKCQHTDFLSDTDLFPFEMPPAVCPVCRADMIADGYNLTNAGAPDAEIYTEVPTVIRRQAIEDLRAYLEKSGNRLFELSQAQRKEFSGRDMKRFTEFCERRQPPLSDAERAEIAKKCSQRRAMVPSYYANCFCAVRAEPLYTFGPVTTVNGKTAVGFDPEEWAVRSHIRFTVASPESDRLDELTNAAGEAAGEMDFHDREVFAALAAELPEEEAKTPESFREWMEVCKKHPRILPVADDRGALYFAAWREYRLKWLELHASDACTEPTDGKKK